MERRGFLKLLGGLVGGVALDEVIPFNRVWSFPTKLLVPTDVVIAEEPALVTTVSCAAGGQLLTISMITAEALRILQKNLVFYKYTESDWERPFVGQRINVRRPNRYVVANSSTDRKVLLGNDRNPQLAMVGGRRHGRD